MRQPSFIFATGRHAGTWLLQVSLYDKKSKVLFGHLGFLRYEGHRTGKKRGHSFRVGTRGSAKNRGQRMQASTNFNVHTPRNLLRRHAAGKKRLRGWFL